MSGAEEGGNQRVANCYKLAGAANRAHKFISASSITDRAFTDFTTDAQQPLVFAFYDTLGEAWGYSFLLDRGQGPGHKGGGGRKKRDDTFVICKHWQQYKVYIQVDYLQLKPQKICLYGVYLE